MFSETGRVNIAAVCNWDPEILEMPRSFGYATDIDVYISTCEDGWSTSANLSLLSRYAKRQE